MKNQIQIMRTLIIIGLAFAAGDAHTESQTLFWLIELIIALICFNL